MADCKTTTTPSIYERYTKPRYDGDPDFRSKVLAKNAMWAEKAKEVDAEAYNRKRCEYSKRCYDRHPEYKDKKREYSRLYRLRKKGALNEQVVLVTEIKGMVLS